MIKDLQIVPPVEMAVLFEDFLERALRGHPMHNIVCMKDHVCWGGGERGRFGPAEILFSPYKSGFIRTEL